MSDPSGPKAGRYKESEFASVPVAPPAIANTTVAAGTEIPPPRRRRYGRWFAWLAASFLAVAMIYDAVAFVWRFFVISPFAGAAAGALLAAAMVAGIVWIADELKRYYKLKAADRFRVNVARLRGSTSRGEGLAIVNAIAPSLRANEASRAGLVRLQEILRSSHSDSDVITLFAREVLDPLDRQAAARVSRAARDTAIGVAASPVAMLDAVIGIARSLRMIREIATIYGLRPGTFGTIRLMRRVLLDGASFATADLASDAWTEIIGSLGGRVTGIVSGKLGEGVFAAVRITRLGLITMQACRPVPFADEQRLGALRRELIANVFTGLIPGRRREETEPAKRRELPNDEK